MSINVTVQQLRVFVTVAEELHFGRAAARLNMTQPPVTRHIKALERMTGTALFDRTPRQVALTRAGDYLLVEAKAVLSRLDHALLHARTLAAGAAAPLRLGCVEAVALDRLPSVLAELRTAHPDLDWELREDHTTELLRGLEAGELDCAILRGPVEPTEQVDVLPLYADAVLAALPAEHPLEGAEIPLAALADEDFVVYDRQVRQGLHPVVVQACVEAGFTPRIRHQASSTQTVLSLVAAGDGVALVSSSVRLLAPRGVRLVRLRPDSVQSPILFAWRRDCGHPTLSTLRSLLQDDFGGQTGRAQQGS
jgi:DNA-binding transcriptional LysR family regulator